ncbi:MAG: hypothetical protein GY749_10560 [Desulfobacteraceae bacterium]|nr:hypothetical protein [Desulfobacteraceae bacterium]
MATIKNKTDLYCIIILFIIAGIILIFGTYPAWAGPNSSAGCALDMDYTTHDYDPHISSKDIETAITAQANDEIWVAVVAQNVINLDTYQAEVDFDIKCLEFMEGYEDNPLGGIDNLLKKNGGTSVGFSVTEKRPGTINIANSLIGDDETEAPEGSGIIALLKFKVLDCTSDHRMTLSDVNYLDSGGTDDSITAFINSGSPGDVNRNGKIGIEDAVYILQIVSGIR